MSTAAPRGPGRARHLCLCPTQGRLCLTAQVLKCVNAEPQRLGIARPFLVVFVAFFLREELARPRATSNVSQSFFFRPPAPQREFEF